MDRKGYIGASDTPVILGESFFKSPYQLWQEKTGEIKDEFTGNHSTELGHILEPDVAKKFTKRTGIELNDPQDAQVACPELDFLKARPDFYLLDDEGKKVGVLECKTALKDSADAVWQRGCPDGYWWQVQTQLLCTGFKVAYIACITNSDFYYYKILADKDAHEKILKEVEHFWDLVQTKQRPVILDKNKDKEYKTEDPLIDEAIHQYTDLQKEIKEKEAELSVYRKMFTKTLSDCAGYKHNGHSATWVHRKDSTEFDKYKAERFLKERLKQPALGEYYKLKKGYSYIKVSCKKV